MVFQATLEDLSECLELAQLLWPSSDKIALEKELEQLLQDSNAALFIEKDKLSRTLGFAQVQLRFDYVEGTRSSPVGYLEGIYVREESRREGLAKRLISACESWAKVKGCSEFASDCELTNTESYMMHLKLGFGEVNRVICFNKDL
ncbi:GNAT family N-acetyltransferase [Vagococcus sp. PNs007]|uniref:Aminoglycoside N(6')-acetyltransferase type 1 n=1 Tax=Vagococcus proximus TaxID=2991417 RepID=A0ABT5X1J1_9ENTE|nr:aminoglycoside 6'-N-acetyltransferase [Vagococcus proximus]MDF0479868.1 GNAT family N-acetyltransferase [Vagococcus proximus]